MKIDVLPLQIQGFFLHWLQASWAFHIILIFPTVFSSYCVFISISFVINWKTGLNKNRWLFYFQYHEVVNVGRVCRLDTYFCVNRIGRAVHKLQCWESKANVNAGELLWCLVLCWWELECSGEGDDSPRVGQWSSGRLGIRLDHLSPGLTAWHLNCILFLSPSLHVSALL